jgi:copper(I)-binding protein
MRALVLAALIVAGAACGESSDEELAVHDVWARATPAVVSVGVVYLRVTSPDDDELVGATVDPAMAASVQLHSTEVDDNGTATMTEQPSLPVPAGGELVLDPLGSHLMLVGLADPLTAGERFDITLEFATAGSLTAEVTVRDSAP